MYDDGQKQMITGYLTVFVGGKEVDKMYPGKWFFRHHENEPTTEVAIRRSMAEDLYIVLAADRQSAATQAASLQIVVNPLVNWIWFGFGMLAFGTGIALLPERRLPRTAGSGTPGWRNCRSIPASRLDSSLCSWCFP